DCLSQQTLQQTPFDKLRTGFDTSLGLLRANSLLPTTDTAHHSGLNIYLTPQCARASGERPKSRRAAPSPASNRRSHCQIHYNSCPLPPFPHHASSVQICISQT